MNLKVLQHPCECVGTLLHTATLCNTLQPSATQYNILQNIANHCNNYLIISSRAAPINPTSGRYCNTLQHTATQCNILQHNATIIQSSRAVQRPYNRLLAGTDGAARSVCFCGNFPKSQLATQCTIDHHFRADF